MPDQTETLDMRNSAKIPFKAVEPKQVEELFVAGAHEFEDAKRFVAVDVHRRYLEFASISRPADFDDRRLHIEAHAKLPMSSDDLKSLDIWSVLRDSCGQVDVGWVDVGYRREETLMGISIANYGTRTRWYGCAALPGHRFPITMNSQSIYKFPIDRFKAELHELMADGLVTINQNAVPADYATSFCAELMDTHGRWLTYDPMSVAASATLYCAATAYAASQNDRVQRALGVPR